VYPVGRLDYDSEGLLLLTNDGDLAYALTHPKYKVPKTYLVRVAGVPAATELEHMARGLWLEDGLTAPALVRLIDENEGNALLEVTIHEGRKRQVRRMCERIGHRVLKLLRVKIGNLVLDGLRPGEYRFLSRDEVEGLKALAGLKPQTAGARVVSDGSKAGSALRPKRGHVGYRQV